MREREREREGEGEIERERDQRKFVDQEGDIELDGNDQLGLDLGSEHNDDELELDLFSDSKDRALKKKKNRS